MDTPINGHAPTPEQQPQMRSAQIIETFTPPEVNVNVIDAQIGQPGRLELQQFIGPIGPGEYLICKVSTFTPELAIAVGSYLIKEGNRLKSGLLLAGPGDAPPATQQ